MKKANASAMSRALRVVLEIILGDTAMATVFALAVGTTIVVVVPWLIMGLRG